MKQIKLSNWERVNLVACLEQQQGDLARLRGLMRVLDVLELPEGAEIGDREAVEELMFEDADFNLLHSTATGHQGWQVNRDALNLLEKLDAAKNERHPRRKE